MWHLKKAAHRKKIREALGKRGFPLQDNALKFAAANLSEDWTIVGEDLSALVIDSKNNKHAFALTIWAAIIQSLYDLRGVPKIDEQIRRLSLPSLEKINTALVILVAGRYRRLKHCKVEFERGRSDLHVSWHAVKAYVEVKRENFSEHRRFQRMGRVGARVSQEMQKTVGDFLSNSGRRLEIFFTNLFGDGEIERIVNQITPIVPQAALGTEIEIESREGTRLVVLENETPPFYTKGFHSTTITVPARTTVTIDPRRPLIKCGFEWKPNLRMLGKRTRDAYGQLTEDLNKDPTAGGFIVLECVHGEESVKAVKERFWNSLPLNCWGILVLSEKVSLLTQNNLDKQKREFMEIVPPLVES